MVVVTNLFRDQLDRFGELDTTARLIAQGMNKNQSFAVLNADDPNVSQLLINGSKWYYGIESLSTRAISPDEVPVATGQYALGSMFGANNMELSYCSQCGSEVSYDFVYYGQLWAMAMQ